MKIAHVMIVLLLSALLIGLITSLAAADVQQGRQPGNVQAVYAAAQGDAGKVPRASVVPTPPRVTYTGGLVTSPTASPTASPMATVKRMLAVPAATMGASPTPVPGGYTPRFPGEPGAGKAAIVPSPTPTPVPQPVSAVRAGAGAPGTRGNTIGACNCVPLDSPLRYAARGPGIWEGAIVPGPASAPGPMASPRAVPTRR